METSPQKPIDFNEKGAYSFPEPKAIDGCDAFMFRRCDGVHVTIYRDARGMACAAETDGDSAILAGIMEPLSGFLEEGTRLGLPRF